MLRDSQPKRLLAAEYVLLNPRLHVLTPPKASCYKGSGTVTLSEASCHVAPDERLFGVKEEPDRVKDVISPDRMVCMPVSSLTFPSITWPIWYMLFPLPPTLNGKYKSRSL